MTGNRTSGHAHRPHRTLANAAHHNPYIDNHGRCPTYGRQVTRRDDACPTSRPQHSQPGQTGNRTGLTRPRPFRNDRPERVIVRTLAQLPCNAYQTGWPQGRVVTGLGRVSIRSSQDG